MLKMSARQTINVEAYFGIPCKMHSCISVFCKCERCEWKTAHKSDFSKQTTKTRIFEYYSIFHLNERKLQFNAVI